MPCLSRQEHGTLCPCYIYMHAIAILSLNEVKGKRSRAIMLVAISTTENEIALVATTLPVIPAEAGIQARMVCGFPPVRE